MKLEDFNTGFGKKIFQERLQPFFPEEKKEEPKIEDNDLEIKIKTPKENLIEKINNLLKEETPKEYFKGEVPSDEDLLKEVSLNENSSNQFTLKYERPLDIYSITKYFKNNNVVGEEANGCITTIALANKLNVIIEGDSGSGKSYLADTILKLYDCVYNLELNSTQSVWYQTEQINSCNIVMIPELQKAVTDRSSKSTGIIELIKNITEGKNAVKSITNKSRNGVDTYTINSGKTILSTLAKENSFKPDKELQRRFLILETDNSAKHLEDVIDHKILRRLNINLDKEGKNIEKILMDRMNYVQNLENTYILNPFVTYLQNSFPVTPKIQSYLDHYLNLFDAYGKFFSPEREKLEIDGNTFVMLNLEDVYNIHSMYNSHFLKTLQSFNPDKEIDSFNPNWDECFKEGVETAKYQLNVGNINLGKEYSSFIDHWVDKQVKNSKIHTVDYKTGEDKIIAEYQVGGLFENAM